MNWSLEHGDDEVFKAREDEVDSMECEKNEQQITSTRD